MFKIGNNFNLLYSENEVCETFKQKATRRFNDMKLVTYICEVLKTFKSKALGS